MLGKIKAFLAREWAMLTTKIGAPLAVLSGFLFAKAGLLASAIATVAPAYAAFDRRIALGGFAVGVVLTAWREKDRA